jgi:hypothetical protein
VDYDVKNLKRHWLWRGAVDRDGHGKFKHKGRVLYAHRVAYTLTEGRTPKKRMVLHECNTPACCNPTHLYAGTAVENALDYWREKQGRTQVRR